jgi:hypothetical protein
MFGETGYIAVRLYPHATGVVMAGGSVGIECVNKWRRQRIKHAVPEEWPPWRHPILTEIRLLATLMQWPSNAERCTMTRASRSLTRRHVSRVPSS